MLVLSRQVTERIVIPTVQTSITVTAIRSRVVRLGIEAPPSIPVFREELVRRQTSLESIPLEIGWNHSNHLSRDPFNLVMGTLRALAQQPLIQSHPGLEGMLLHFLDQMRATKRCVP